MGCERREVTFDVIDAEVEEDEKRTIIDPDSHTVFEWLPDTNAAVRACFV